MMMAITREILPAIGSQPRLDASQYRVFQQNLTIAVIAWLGNPYAGGLTLPGRLNGAPGQQLPWALTKRPAATSAMQTFPVRRSFMGSRYLIGGPWGYGRRGPPLLE